MSPKRPYQQLSMWYKSVIIVTIYVNLVKIQLISGAVQTYGFYEGDDTM